MEWLSNSIHAIAWAVGRLVGLVIPLIDQIDAVIRQQLESLGVPFQWQSTVIVAAWGIPVFIIARLLPAIPRFFVLLLVLLVVARLYGAFDVD